MYKTLPYLAQCSRPGCCTGMLQRAPTAAGKPREGGGSEGPSAGRPHPPRSGSQRRCLNRRKNKNVKQSFVGSICTYPMGFYAHCKIDLSCYISCLRGKHIIKHNSFVCAPLQIASCVCCVVLQWKTNILLYFLSFKRVTAFPKERWRKQHILPVNI